MLRTNWFLQIIGVMLATLLLAGCSMLRLGYGQLPDLAYWWVDAYIDVTDAQTPRLRRELDELHRWHRGAELPQLAQLLQKMQRLAAQPVTPEQACALFDEARARYEATRARVEAPALWLAQTLQPAQLEHLARKYAKNNSDWQDDWLSGTPEQRLKRRLKLALDRAEQFYGSLTEAQIQTLRADLARSSHNAQTLWTERQRRQQDVLQTLGQLSAGVPPPGSPQAQASLRALLERLTRSPDPAYRAYSDTMIRESCASFARLHNSTSPTQRAQAVETLRRYEDDVRTLMAAAPP